MSNAGMTVGLIVMVIILGLVYLAVMVCMIWAYVRIIRRAGYSGWWILMALVPIGNIVMFLIFAFKEWPIQRELRWLREQVWAAQYRGGQHGAPPNYGGQGGWAPMR